MEWSWLSYGAGLGTGMIAFWIWALWSVNSRDNDDEERFGRPRVVEYERNHQGNVIGAHFPKEKP